MTDKEAKTVKTKAVEWVDVESLAKSQDKLITQIYTTAKNAPELFYCMRGNAKVIPADKNYIVFADGSQLDIN
jgi:hypothetical protein